jgi:DNA-binding transcriptional ArsR family regulator
VEELQLIAPQQGPQITFAVEPVYNALCSLFLLSSHVADSVAWARQMREGLTPEQLETNAWVSQQAMRAVGGVAWPSFPDWVDDLAQRDPLVWQQAELRSLHQAALELLDDAQLVPAVDELLASRETYIALMERLCECKGEPCDWEHYRRTFDQLRDPAATLEAMVAHLRAMWDLFLAAEWERVRPLVEDSVAAFQSLDWSDRPAADALTAIVARDPLPGHWADTLLSKETLILIPSTHIAPYLLVIDKDVTWARIMFGARVPAGAQVQSPALTRSELLTRLTVLADDTRLRILKLLADGQEWRAQAIMDALDISQSTASRQLRELVATGYLSSRRRDGAKVYRLKRDRVGDTLGSLQSFLGAEDEP